MLPSRAPIFPVVLCAFWDAIKPPVIIESSNMVRLPTYNCAIVVDACVPVSPLSLIETPGGADALVNDYTVAGVTFAVFTIVDDYPNSIEQTIRLIAANRRYFLSRPEKYVLADKVDDVRAAKAAGKLAAGFAFQGSGALLGDLAMVEVYRRLGVMQMLLAYNAANLVADGCHESRNAGLSQFGRDVVAEMNRIGMIVDVTHVGLRSSLEAMELTTKPPIFSHSTPKKFAPHDRNITDEQIRACAAKDGMVCLTGVGLFMDAARQKATAARFAETIDYVVQLVGARHAGIGLDYIDADAMARYFRANAALYGGGGQYPADGRIDFAPPKMLPEVANELIRRGYKDADMQGILGENYLRVWQSNQCA